MVFGSIRFPQDRSRYGAIIPMPTATILRGTETVAISENIWSRLILTQVTSNSSYTKSLGGDGKCVNLIFLPPPFNDPMIEVDCKLWGASFLVRLNFRFLV